MRAGCKQPHGHTDYNTGCWFHFLCMYWPGARPGQMDLFTVAKGCSDTLLTAEKGFSFHNIAVGREGDRIGV